MAKDPAFLFYSQDFFVGTFSMTDEQVGKYIRLLCLQHSKNELEMKDMLNICQTYDKHVFGKFFKTTRETYYNKRLRETMEKRRKYSESRRKNRLSQSYVKHMENENENENVTINIEDINNYIIEKELNIDGEYYLNSRTESKWIKANNKPVLNWKLDIQNAAKSGKWPTKPVRLT